MIKEEIMEYTLNEYDEGNNVKVHITRLDTDKEYDTTAGVYINGNLKKIFELENITNDYLDKFENEIRTEIRKRTLYLIRDIGIDEKPKRRLFK